MAFIYPLLIASFFLILALGLVFVVFVIVAAPFLLIGNHMTPQHCLKDRSNMLVTVITIILLYPLFFLYSLIYLVYHTCKYNKVNELNVPIQRAVMVFIMPCLILGY